MMIRFMIHGFFRIQFWPKSDRHLSWFSRTSMDTSERQQPSKWVTRFPKASKFLPLNPFKILILPDTAVTWPKYFRRGQLLSRINNSPFNRESRLLFDDDI